MDLAARISYFRFFTTVQIYEFHISKIIIAHSCLFHSASFESVFVLEEVTLSNPS